MPVTGCFHSVYHASLCSTTNKQPFRGLQQQQGCTQCRAKSLSFLPRAEQQISQDNGGQDDAAYMERLLGDSASRLPKQLSVSPVAALYASCHTILGAKIFAALAYCMLGHSSQSLRCWDPSSFRLLCTTRYCTCGCRRRHRSNCSNYGWKERDPHTFRMRLSLLLMMLVVSQAQEPAPLLRCTRSTAMQSRTQLLAQVQQNACQQRQN